MMEDFKAFLKSPLRYPGGKSRALKFLKDFFPASFDEYREPFFGGGSVGIYTAQLYKGQNIGYFANDLNYDLYCFWQSLKVNFQELIDGVQKHKETYRDGRTLYSDILTRRNEDLDVVQRAVDFFILNRITFSGLIDCGGYSQKAYESRFTQSSIERLKSLSNLARIFTFSFDSYEALLRKDGNNVFIFLDPPYLGASKSRLYGKKGDLHISFDHQRLCKLLKSTKHKFLLTYDDNQEIRELYKDFYLKEWNLQYGMNNFRQVSVSAGKELLIYNFEPIKSASLFGNGSLNPVAETSFMAL